MVATPAPAAAPAGFSCCLLLALEPAVPGGRWHARVLAPDGAVIDFDSPFELVRYLSHAARQLPPAGPGLR